MVFNLNSWLNIAMLVFIILIFIMLIILLIVAATSQSPESLDKLMEFSEKQTDRINDNVNIRLRYKYANVKENYPDLAQIEDIINRTLQTSEDLPAISTWEKVLRFMVHDIYEKFNIIGISIQLTLRNNESYVATKGYITSLKDF